MPADTVQTGFSPDELIAAVERMDPADAECVTQRLLHIQASRRAPSLTEREAELLNEIYHEKRSGFQERFDLLSEKRRSFALTPEEHEELLRMVDESEAFTVRRLKALGELAHLRQLSLPTLMKQLGLKAPPVA